MAAVLTDPRRADNPIVACNDRFVALTGYLRDEILGRNCRFLAGLGTQTQGAGQLRAAIHDRRPVLVELLNYRKDGTPFRNAVMVAPIFDAQGQVEYFLGSQVEVRAAGAIETASASARARIDALTSRQREILLEMAAGKLNKQIAWELGLSERTIKMHRSALFRALGLATSAEAIRLAVEAGF